MNLKRVLLIAILSLSIIVTSSIIVIKHQAFALDNSINDMMSYVYKNAKENGITSSNPYDYVVDNPYFDEIVDRGIDIVPEIEKYMKSSGKNGYREYILAIAIEEITKMDLKGDNYNWECPITFKSAFDKHVKSIPSKVKEIRYSNKTYKEKNEELKKIGTLAIPFIMEEIENGAEELTESLFYLLEGSKKVKIKNYNIMDVKDFIKDNKDLYKNIKEYVKNK